MKVERRRKMVVEKDYHSDTYVAETGNDYSAEDRADCSRVDLENKVYDANKNKRASLYSDFGDLDLTFVVDEECYFRDRDEDINFESDTDDNNDDSGNYDLFNNYDDKEHEEEIFQELLAEVESNTLPTTAAPTVENDDLSQDGDFCDTADEEETESDVLASFQEVKISEKALKLDKMTEFSTESETHETAIVKDETNDIQACEILAESTLTAGAATETEYEEHSDISGQKESLPSQKAIMVNLQSDSISELSEQQQNTNPAEECLTGPAIDDVVDDIKQVSTFVNAKDDDITTEEITEAKLTIDSLPENDDVSAGRDIDNVTKESTTSSVEDADLLNNTEDATVQTVTESSQCSNIETTEEIFDSQSRQNNTEDRETSEETVNVSIENISQGSSAADPEAVESINHSDDQKIVTAEEVEESLDRCNDNDDTIAADNENDSTAADDGDANLAEEKQTVIDSQQESQSPVQNDNIQVNS